MNLLPMKFTHFGLGALLSLAIILSGCTQMAATTTPSVAPDQTADQTANTPQLWPVFADGTEMERAMVDQPRAIIKPRVTGSGVEIPYLWPVEDDGMELERGIYDKPLFTSARLQ